ncbi:uncharacterized protein AMSG_11790 [Thecamonas trahens ATCC 50062]|uniref:DNA/RNA-binding protein Alba-like domain-containing protein n=1 Tax=Thecamonas trahens ATCC 50062 TaxID=461836 RepID=A0A0L0D5U5_THETB|nr:hypothetical protein AMSG_11790 [Thecamonas trahens ATCC 50062]KNC47724.1 hypothetical protein AMSG_11790 [Thecamonas trahens ATCC 50062]|eukprot:XP_013759367.1 hypothetical protein AMSG_11790 [Thecamonas trahens ATCC 50062]
MAASSPAGTNGGLPAHAIGVTTQGKVKLYVGYGAKVLAEGPMLEIRARGRAVPKAVSVAEALKRKIPGLHQVSTIESHNDHPAMIIVLSKDPPLGAPDLIGYQHSADNV